MVEVVVSMEIVGESTTNNVAMVTTKQSVTMVTSEYARAQQLQNLIEKRACAVVAER